MNGTRRAFLAAFAAACLAGCASPDGRPPGGEEEGAPAMLRLPAGAENCAAAADAGGTIHAVYESGGRVFYVRAQPGAGWSFPLPVNSSAGSISNSQGPLKSPDLALGRDGRVHAVWGAGWASEGRSYVNYAFLDGEGFSPAQAFEIPSYSWAVAADGTGNVAVLHNSGELVLSLSADNGERFSRGLDMGAPRACADSGVSAVFSGEDFLYCAYRGLSGTDSRAYLVVGPRGLGEFGFRDLGWTPRPSEACVPSRFSLSALESGAVAAWTADGRVWWTRLDRWGKAQTPGDSRTFAMTADWPCVVAGGGRILVAWKEGSRITWQSFGPEGSEGGLVGNLLGSGLGRFAGVPGPGGSFRLID